MNSVSTTTRTRRRVLFSRHGKIASAFLKQQEASDGAHSEFDFVFSIKWSVGQKLGQIEQFFKHLVIIIRWNIVEKLLVQWPRPT